MVHISRRCFFAAALLSVPVLSSACSGDTGPSNITYRATGSAIQLVSLTYAGDGGSTQQISRSPVPWTYTFRANRGDFLYVSAQIVQGNGSVTVSIVKDGKDYKTATSSGFAAIATAQGSND